MKNFIFSVDVIRVEIFLHFMRIRFLWYLVGSTYVGVLVNIYEIGLKVTKQEIISREHNQIKKTTIQNYIDFII